MQFDYNVINPSPNFRSVNKKVAVEPFPSTSIETKNRAGFTTVIQKTELIPLKVVFSSLTPQGLGVDPGHVVYVKGETTQHQWAKEVFELDGKKFIFIPEESVVLVDFNPPKKDG